MRLAPGPIHVRIPTRPVDSVESVYSAEDLVRAIRDNLTPAVRSALLVASRDLHEALAGLDDDGSHPGRRLRIATRVLAYLIRMGWRTTPFGLFAGVGLVEPGDSTTLVIRTRERRTAMRFDAQWLFRHVTAAAERAFDAGMLHVEFSDTVLSKGDRLFVIAEPRPGEAGEDVANLSLRSVSHSAPVELIKTLAATPVAVRELSDALIGMTGIGAAEAFAYVRSLWASGFLVTAVAPDPTRDPVRLALDFLAVHDPSLAAELGAMQALLDEVDALRGDAGWERIPAISQAAASKSTTVQEMLQVDVVVPCTGTLGRNVLRAAERYAELMLRASIDAAAVKYREIFRDVFEGHERLVPLLEFVEATLTVRSTAPIVLVPDAQATAARSACLAELMARAAATGDISVSLSANDVEVLYPPIPDNSQLPRSLEFGIQVLAASAADVDEDRFWIRPTGLVASNKNSIVGRFAGILGRAIAEDGDEDGAVDVELVYPPLHTRMMNVVNRPPTALYEVAPGLPSTAPEVGRPIRLPLTDLFVGLNAAHALRLYSKRLGRELRVHQTNMLAWQRLAPPVAHTIAVIGGDGVRAIGPFSWGALDGADFKPRLVHDHIILSPATWRVRMADLGCDSPERSAKLISELRTKRRIPRYVALCSGDNQLLIDLDSPWGRALLCDQARGQTTAMLQEAASEPAETWIHGEDGRYAVEFVVGFDTVAADGHSGRRTVSAGSRADRIASPTSEWLYLQIFAARETFDTLLRTALAPCAEAAGSRTWFFVRYGDTDPHIRFRLKLPDDAARQSVLRAMDGLLQDGLVRRYSIATYEREIERYGGPAALDLCERLFTVSSRWSIARIARRESKEARTTGSVLDALAMARASMTSRQLAELLAILQTTVPRQKASQADRTFLREAQAALESGASQRSDAEIAAIASEFRALSDLELTTKSLPQVFPSLHHMHCNRLGLSKDEEARAGVLFAKALFSICRTRGALVPGMTIS